MSFSYNQRRKNIKKGLAKPGKKANQNFKKENNYVR